MKHTKRNITQRPGCLFYSGQSWVRQDESGSQQLAAEFGRIVYAHRPRHAKEHAHD